MRPLNRRLPAGLRATRLVGVDPAIEVKRAGGGPRGGTGQGLTLLGQPLLTAYAVALTIIGCDSRDSLPSGDALAPIGRPGVERSLERWESAIAEVTGES